MPQKHKPRPYCTQPRDRGEGCETCSLVNYGRDCRNNPIQPAPAGETRQKGVSEMSSSEITIRFPLERPASVDLYEHRLIISNHKLDFRCHSGMYPEDDDHEDRGILFVRGESHARRETYEWYGDGEYTNSIAGFTRSSWDMVRAALDQLPDDPIDRRSEYLRIRRALAEASSDEDLQAKLHPDR